MLNQLYGRTITSFSSFKILHMKYIDGRFIHSTLDEGYDFYITDSYKRKYHFKISSFILGDKLVSEAIEVVEGKRGREPYIFNVLSDFDADLESSELLLKARIKKGINRRYLKTIRGDLHFGDNNNAVGRIDYMEDAEDSVFSTQLVIDGRRITIEQFVSLLEPYHAFNFKLEIFDPSDDIPD